MKQIKRLLFIFLFLLGSFIAKGKIPSDSSIVSPKWLIGWEISPNYTHRIISNWPQIPRKSYQPSDQEPKLGWHHGLLFSRKITSWLYGQTGLLLDRKGYKTKYIYDSIHTKNNVILAGLPLELDYTHFYLQLPLLVNAKIDFSKKIYLNIATGIAFNILKYERKYRGSHKETDFNGDTNMALICKLGLSFLFKKDRYITLLPTYSYMINSFDDTYIQGAKINLYSVGLELGIHYSLDRKNK